MVPKGEVVACEAEPAPNSDEPDEDEPREAPKPEEVVCVLAGAPKPEEAGWEVGGAPNGVEAGFAGVLPNMEAAELCAPGLDPKPEKAFPPDPNPEPKGAEEDCAPDDPPKSGFDSVLAGVAPKGEAAEDGDAPNVKEPDVPDPKSDEPD